MPFSILICFITLSTFAHTSKELSQLLYEVRDSSFESSDRLKILTYVQSKMKLEDQGPEVQTQFYVTLHQEAFHQQWLKLQSTHHFSDYGKYLVDKMLSHLGDYDPVKEGVIYSRWLLEGKTRVPFFQKSGTISELTEIEAHVPFEKLFPAPQDESVMNPALSRFMQNAPQLTRVKYQELAEKLALNRHIYLRAVANASKTVATLNYLTGEKTLSQTEHEVSAFINEFCEGCSVSEKERFLAGAIQYVEELRKLQTAKNVEAITTGFCSALVENGYFFDRSIPKKTKFGPTLVVADNSSTQGTFKIAVTKKKIEAIQAVIYNQTLGILFVTSALAEQNAVKEPLGTNLDCSSKFLSRDMALVRQAISEAKTNVGIYMRTINDKVTKTELNLKSVDETLEYFTQTNVSATSEAIMTFPQGMNYVLSAIRELDRDETRRKHIDTAVAWGGTIVGLGLTFSGVGTPAGVTIIMTIGTVKGVAFGVYYFIRTQKEKHFARELQIARGGLGGEFLLDQHFSLHYRRYAALKLTYMMEFAGSAMGFGNLFIETFRKTKEINVTYTIFSNVFQRVAKMGKGRPAAVLHRMILENLYGEIKYRDH